MPKLQHCIVCNTRTNCDRKRERTPSFLVWGLLHASFLLILTSRTTYVSYSNAGFGSGSGKEDGVARPGRAVLNVKVWQRIRQQGRGRQTWPSSLKC